MSGKLTYRDILNEVNKWDFDKKFKRIQEFVNSWHKQHPRAARRDYPELIRLFEEQGIISNADIARAYDKYRSHLPPELKKKDKFTHIIELPSERIKIIRTPKSTVSLSTGPAIKKRVAGRRNIKIDSAVKAHTKTAYNELCKQLYHSNTVASLKVIAAANGLTGFSKMNKAELCEAIASINYQ
jgi:hypothetical protein